jgi:hypothetical protein
VHHTDADTRLFARFKAATTVTTSIRVDLSQPSRSEKQIHYYIWTSDTHPSSPVYLSSRNPYPFISILITRPLQIERFAQCLSQASSGRILLPIRSFHPSNKNRTPTRILTRSFSRVCLTNPSSLQHTMSSIISALQPVTLHSPKSTTPVPLPCLYQTSQATASTKSHLPIHTQCMAYLTRIQSNMSKLTKLIHIRPYTTERSLLTHNRIRTLTFPLSHRKATTAVARSVMATSIVSQQTCRTLHSSDSKAHKGHGPAHPKRKDSQAHTPDMAEA